MSFDWEKASKDYNETCSRFTSTPMYTGWIHDMVQSGVDVLGVDITPNMQKDGEMVAANVTLRVRDESSGTPLSNSMLMTQATSSVVFYAKGETRMEDRFVLIMKYDPKRGYGVLKLPSSSSSKRSPARAADAAQFVFDWLATHGEKWRSDAPVVLMGSFKSTTPHVIHDNDVYAVEISKTEMDAIAAREAARDSEKTTSVIVFTRKVILSSEACFAADVYAGISMIEKHMDK